MANKRKKVVRIRRPEQIQVLNSAVAIGIIDVLRQRGAATVAELGPRLGRSPNSLHYHMRKLLKTGFVHEVGSRRSGARTEAIYDVVADTFVGENAPFTPRLRKLTCDAVASLTRLANRNFAKAAGGAKKLFERGKYRNILATRKTARLTRTQLAAVNRHIEALTEIFDKNIGSDAGELFGITLVMTPLDEGK